MYRLFSKSIQNYFQRNKEQKSARLQIAEPLRLIADIELYKEHEKGQTELFFRAENILRQIQSHEGERGYMGTLAWELEGMGFSCKEQTVRQKIQENPRLGEDEIKEQMKLVQLFSTSTLYW